jgi:diguanylate cyclase (GGDEF)-like protein
MLKRPSVLFQIRAFFARHPNAIGFGCTAFAIVMLGLVGVVLAQAHRDATARAIENAENLARVVEHDIAHTTELTDLSIQAAVDGAQDADIMRLPARYRQEILFDRSATASQYLGALLYLDATGKITIDSSSPIPRNANLGDREWFTVHRDNPHLGLYVSAPLQSRLRPGAVEIMLSRRVNHPNGSFAGVVVGAFRVDYFLNLFSNLNLGPNGTITLIQSDGQVIYRYQNHRGTVNENLNGRTNFERYKRTHETAFFGNSGRDGERRLYVFRKFDKLDMTVIVAPTSRYILADWTARAVYISVLAILLVAGLLAMAWLLAVEFRHRLSVEGHLRTMTLVDGLTGLSNRRNLDDHLMLEWRRSLRSRRPLAILFVDIDRFKNYNDTYGHQAGDDTLTAVAQAIARSARRPSDLAARFGGEEFVVILPDTDNGGAALIAASIHSAVRALAIDQSGSEYGAVTVSIGLACTDINQVVDPLALMRLADLALYRAKALGRNRTCTAEPAGETVVAEHLG